MQCSGTILHPFALYDCAFFAMLAREQEWDEFPCLPRADSHAVVVLDSFHSDEIWCASYLIGGECTESNG
jgi:hypothetical protein